MQVIRLAAAQNPRVAAQTVSKIHHYEYILQDYKHYIHAHGEDPAEISEWQWS